MGKINYHRALRDHTWIGPELADLLEVSEMCLMFSHLEALYYEEMELKHKDFS